MKKVYTLEGLDCAVCAQKIEDAVRKVPGVSAARVNFILQKLTVEAGSDAGKDVFENAKLAALKAEPGLEIGE